MQHVLRTGKLKIIDERAILADGGCTNPRAICHQIGAAYFRQQSLQSADESRLVERPVKLSGTATPIFCRHVPKPWICEGCSRILQAKIGSPIAFSFDCQ